MNEPMIAEPTDVTPVTTNENVVAENAPDALLNTFWTLLAYIRSLSPLKDGYCSVSFSGYKDSQQSLRVFYGDGLSFECRTLEELREKLMEYDPEKAKADKIASLKAQLAELEGNQQEAK